jgi:hypothetical protein
MLPFKKFISEKYNVLYKKENDRDYAQMSVSDSQFNQAFRYLQVNEEVVEEARKHIKSLGLGDMSVKQIISTVLQHDNPGNFFNALQNKMTSDEFFGSGNIVEAIAKRYNIDRELIVNLLNYQAATQPVTGKGEAIVLLFVQGAKKGKTGDVVVNDNIVYEIKGSDARLRGQKGFGTVTSAIVSFKNGLNALAKKANIKLADSLSFTIGKKDLGAINFYAPQLIASGKVTKEDIVRVYAKGFKELYQSASDEVLTDWLRGSLTDEGTVVIGGTDTNSFYKNYFIFALRYYASMEEFAYIALLNTTKKPIGDVTYLSRSAILGDDESQILSRIQPDGAPSLTAGAGAQGAFFAIKPA